MVAGPGCWWSARRSGGSGKQSWGGWAAIWTTSEKAAAVVQQQLGEWLVVMLTILGLEYLWWWNNGSWKDRESKQTERWACALREKTASSVLSLLAPLRG